MTNDTLRQMARGFKRGLNDALVEAGDADVRGFDRGYQAGLLARDLAPLWLAFSLTAGVGYYFGWRDGRQAR